MPRFPRIVIPGAPHHITQRGNNRLDVFFVNDGRHVYLALLKKHGAEFGLTVQGYCLMTNHIHMVATPQQEHSLAKALGCAHLGYAQYINHMHRRSGHLWQNRFFSCPRENDPKNGDWLKQASLRARRACPRFSWSSAQAHLGKGDPSGLLDLTAWHFRKTGTGSSKRVFERDVPVPAFRWQQLLQIPEEAAFLNTIRLRTQTGRPLASDNFISKIEIKIGRRLRPLPVGRPKSTPKGTKNRSNLP